ncbi:protein transport protein Sec24A [Pelomyxa schiedti]|nr:protein transport protein Sec24A [Pelomyxa schiedti]
MARRYPKNEAQQWMTQAPPPLLSTTSTTPAAVNTPFVAPTPATSSSTPQQLQPAQLVPPQIPPQQQQPSSQQTQQQQQQHRGSFVPADLNSLVPAAFANSGPEDDEPLSNSTQTGAVSALPSPASMTTSPARPPANSATNTTVMGPPGTPTGYQQLYHQNIANNLAKWNCSRRFLRTTTTAIPNTPQLAKAVPLGCIIHPFVTDEEVPIVNLGKMVRCRTCRTYVNPFVQWLNNGSTWKCNICDYSNQVPSDYFSPIIPTTGLRKDLADRPELTYGCVDMVAPSEYLVRQIQPPGYVFVIDVSYPALSSGLVAVVAKAILQFIESCPIRNKVGFVTFNNTVHFYQFDPKLSQPRMMVVPDINNIALPVPNQLLVSLREGKAMVTQFLAKLPNFFSNSKQVGCAFGPALQGAFNVISPIGGKIVSFLSNLPSLGAGALPSREDLKLLGDDKEMPLILPLASDAGDFYKDLALELSRQHTSADIYTTANFCDLATISSLPKITSGRLHRYPSFSPERHEKQLIDDLNQGLASQGALEAVIRLRCSAGLTIEGHFGNFFIRSSDLLALPSVDASQSVAVQLNVNENINSLYCYLQNALLYTSMDGQRRIRVSTLCLPVVSTVDQLFKSIDVEAFLNLTARAAIEKIPTTKLSTVREAIVRRLVDTLNAYRASVHNHTSPQVVIPETLTNMPLYALALIKNAVFRPGGQSLRPDERVFYTTALRSMPVEETAIFVHPRLFSLSNITSDVGTTNAEGQTVLPPLCALSCESITTTSVMLMDTTMGLLLWVGNNAPLEILGGLFGVSGRLSDNDCFAIQNQLPELDNEYSVCVRRLITHLKQCHSWPQHLQICREWCPAEKLHFLQYAVTDKCLGLPSYTEFMNGLHKRS